MSGAVTSKEKSLNRQVEDKDDRISEMQVNTHQLKDNVRNLEL